MLVFSARELAPILQEAKDNQCDVLIVKDWGIYIMSAQGKRENGKHRVAYAQGCDPDKNPDWYDVCHAEADGDDFGEVLCLTDGMVRRIRDKGVSLCITFTATHMEIMC
ncbi:DUF3085 domain-containing protein [Serratia fonticola]|uniref:DUF3085 domain-containing protein n=1 Tax=Serratia fonticola TaxID=47917 RepID=UPI001376F884|nr:DUF3085 domain-containing protein [Serratia fonticola]NCG54499.1 DUF3085 domain-containing protein [Serratia fonticola]